jgi:hypothetical protein
MKQLYTTVLFIFTLSFFNFAQVQGDGGLPKTYKSNLQTLTQKILIRGFLIRQILKRFKQKMLLMTPKETLLGGLGTTTIHHLI